MPEVMIIYHDLRIRNLITEVLLVKMLDNSFDMTQIKQASQKLDKLYIDSAVRPVANHTLLLCILILLCVAHTDPPCQDFCHF